MCDYNINYLQKPKNCVKKHASSKILKIFQNISFITKINEHQKVRVQ